MSLGYDLGTEKTRTVRELMDAVDAVLEADILNPVAFAAAREAVSVKCDELKEQFPELAAPAEEFWFSDSPYAPEWIEEAADATSVAFDVILSSYSVENSATLGQYTHALETLRSELS